MFGSPYKTQKWMKMMKGNFRGINMASWCSLSLITPYYMAHIMPYCGHITRTRTGDIA